MPDLESSYRVRISVDEQVRVFILKNNGTIQNEIIIYLERIQAHAREGNHKLLYCLLGKLGKVFGNKEKLITKDYMIISRKQWIAERYLVIRTLYYLKKKLIISEYRRIRYTFAPIFIALLVVVRIKWSLIENCTDMMKGAVLLTALCFSMHALYCKVDCVWRLNQFEKDVDDLEL